MVTVSIVSHGHANQVLGLLDDLSAINEIDKIIIRINDKSIENKTVIEKLRVDKRCELYINKKRYGFSKNNNLNFDFCKTKYFFILNPDTNIVRWSSESLYGELIIPNVIDLDGTKAENGRSFLTPANTIRRILGVTDSNKEWYGGMAVLIASWLYEELGGFDEGYRLYVEDCDFFYRARQFGFIAREDYRIIIKHEGQRNSRKKPVHFIYHMQGLVRFWKKIYRL